MTYLTRYGIRIGYSLVGIVGVSTLLTTFYYFNLIGDGVFNFLELLTVIINIFINSFLLGKSTNKKGYIEGTKFGGIVIILFLVPTIIFSKFNIRIFIYYFIILVTAILGSMVGISKKRD